MAITRPDLIKEILTHNWRPPMLRILATGPKRFVAIRASLIEATGTSPGDGYISTELRDLRALGLVEQREVTGSRRHAWALTGLGATAVTVIDDIEDPNVALPASPDESHVIPQTRPSQAIEAGSGDGSRQSEQGGTWMDEQQARASQIDTTVPHPARRYNYWLGGKDHFDVDRKSGDLIEKAYPTVRLAARENRAFLQRAVRFLAADAGIDQFLDIGTGLPSANNTHEVAQRVKPESRVVYVDNDPMVGNHARALLASAPAGRCCYLEEDLRNPEQILSHADTRNTLDFDRPVALMLVAVLHFIKDHDEAAAIVHRLMDALPSGSYVAISNFTLDYAAEQEVAAYRAMLARGNTDAYPRARNQFADFLDGMRIVEPGIVPLPDWQPTLPEAQRPPASQVAIYGGVARKP